MAILMPNLVPYCDPRIKPRLGARLDRNHPLSRGLVGAWLMNEGGGNRVNDLSGNGKSGTLVANATWSYGKFGPCVLLDGTDDCISVGANVLTPPFSVSALVYRLAATNMMILGTPGASYEGIWLDYTDAAAAVDGTFAAYQYHLHGSIPTTGQWLHYILVVPTTTVADSQCYINSKLLAKGTSGGTYGSIAWSAIGLGRSAVGLYGYVDNVAIYNRSLSSSEIAQLYREPFAMFQRERIELWGALGGGGGTPATFKPAWAIRRRQAIGGGIL